MRKVYKQDGFIIFEDEDKIKISWMVGAFGKEVSYDISRENMLKALKSKEDAYEVMIFAETGKWPKKENEQLEKDREFIRKFPELLLKIPSNQDLFDKEEVESLLKNIQL